MFNSKKYYHRILIYQRDFQRRFNRRIIQSNQFLEFKERSRSYPFERERSFFGLIVGRLKSWHDDPDHESGINTLSRLRDLLRTYGPNMLDRSSSGPLPIRICLAGNRRSQFASIAFSRQYINCDIVGLGQTWNYTLNAHCAIPLEKTEDGCHHWVEWILLGDLSLNVYWLFDWSESRVHRENRDWSLKSWAVVNLIVVYSYVWHLNQLVRILRTSNSFNIKVSYHIRILPLKVTARETVENISRSENISGEDIETFPCIMPDV